MKIKIIIACLVCFCNIYVANAQTGIYQVWYEYGNGLFYKTSFSTGTALNTFQTGGMPTSGTGQTGQKKIIKIYVPPPPPTGSNIKLHSLRPTVTVPGGVINNSLGAGVNLAIVKSTTDFLSDDTMLVALQYDALLFPAAKKLAFFYNKNTTPSFKTIPIANTIMNLPHDLNTTRLTTTPIRTHNGETFSLASPSQIASLAPGFKNGIIFSAPSANLQKSNIFLTLATFLSIPSTNTENFYAVFLTENNKPINKGVFDNVVNHSGLTSHDPNYEKVDKTCLTPAEANGKRLNYEVHFQNTGYGEADTIVTKTTLPSGYTVADLVGYPTITLGWQIADIMLNRNYVVDASASTGNVLEVRFLKSAAASMILAGTLGMADPLNDVTTMGGFNFSLQLKAPYTAPQILSSSTDIYFDKNDSVKTNSADFYIKECCTCADNNSNNGNNSNALNCLCKKAKRRFWKWLFCKDC